jgi:hypothetical protein
MNSNPVGCLQELCQSNRWLLPKYTVESVTGALHARTFWISCTLQGYKEMGNGGSKKIAKRFAALLMCKRFEKLISPPIQQEEHQPWPTYDTCGKFDLRIRPHSSIENPPQQMAAFPHYQSFDTRLDSFKSRHWPPAIKQPCREDLANAGFFYSGRSDETCCFYCGGGIHEWEENDVPILVHKQFFPKCEFINNK